MIFFWSRTFGQKRSGKWTSFRKRHIKDKCEVCKRTKRLELHHIVPFWVSPDIELDPLNVVTLDRRCHFAFGHFFNWRDWNINIKTWIKDIYETI